MHVPIKVKSPNNISEWQMGFNSAFKGLIAVQGLCCDVRKTTLSKHFKLPKMSTGTPFLGTLQRVNKVLSGFQVNAVLNLIQQRATCCGLWSTYLAYRSVATLGSSLYAPTPHVTWSLTTYCVCVCVRVYVCVCARARARVRVRARVRRARVRVRERMCARVRARVCACMRVCARARVCVCACVHVHFYISKEVGQLYSISGFSVKNQMVFISGRCRDLQLATVAVAPYRSRFHVTSAVWLIPLRFWKILPQSQQDAFQG